MRTMIVCAAAALGLAGAVLADTYPWNASLTPEVAVRARSDRIDGLTLSVWGENPQASFALGLLNGSTGDSTGLSLGLGNYAASYTGLQWSLVNYADYDVTGWQGGFCLGLLASVLNYGGNQVTGVQVGLVNYARRLTGVQLGVINLADIAGPGLQIGILNVIEANRSWFGEVPTALAPVMVLVNWRF